MTNTTTTTNACPQCGHEHPVAMSGGTRFCPNCRHEWNPAELAPPAPATPVENPPTPPDAGTCSDCEHAWVYHLMGAGCTVQLAEGACTCALPPPPVVPLTTPAEVVPDNVTAIHAGIPPTAVDDVLGPPAEVVAADEAQAQLDALVGTEVVLEGGQLATIVAFPDDDHAEVIIGAFTDEARSEVVALGDVERSVTAPAPVIDVSDETAQELARVNMAVAGLALRAGVASVAGEDGALELITPPTGWLPDDVDALPVVEQGVAYAIACLIHAWGLSRETITAVADTLINDSQVEPTKGEDQ